MSDGVATEQIRETVTSRLSSIGRDMRFRVAVAVVFGLAIIASAGISFTAASRLQSIARQLPALLAQANLTAKDPVAVGLVEKGTIEVDGVLVGDPALAKVMERMFERTGKIERVTEAAGLLVGTESPEWLPGPIAQEPGIAVGGGLIALAVVLFACWSGLAMGLVLVSAASATLFLLVNLTGRQHLALSIGAIPLFLFMFSLVVRLLLVALDGPRPLAAVASGVIREAVRQRIALSFAAIAIIAIPLLPQLIDPALPLRYQVQTYLSRSLDLMYLVCAFLTVFLGCATVAFEIRDRQAWTTLTKPVSRLSWLAGKWLGILALDIAILLTCTVAMYAFLAQMRSRPAQDILDAIAVENEVLVARVGSYPAYRMLTPDELQAAVEETMRSDPNIQADLREGTRTELEVKKSLVRAISEDYLKAQRSIGPNLERSYTFSGLEEHRDSGENLSIRYKFYSGESDPNLVYPVIFVFGEGDRQQWIDSNFVAAQSNIVPVPAACIGDNGTLVVRIQNLRVNPNARQGEPQFLPGGSTVFFDPDGLELLHRVGGFDANLLRAQLVNILKLSFIGMLSVVCAANLSFPVACLIVFTVLAAGSIGPFLATSVAEYRIRTESVVLKGFEAVVKTVAGSVEFSVRAFGDAKSNGPLVEGRLVSWISVARALLLLGFAWSGIALLLGFLAFRRKEIAIYSGQGG